MLPEKWFIERNRDNCKIVNDWINKQPNKGGSYYAASGYIYSEPVSEGYHKYSNTDGHSLLAHELFTEITFEQFKKFVLKEFTLPTKWYVVRDENNAEVLNKWENKTHWNGGLGATLSSTAYMFSDKRYCSSYNATNGYVQITFEQFKTHVLKEVMKKIIGYKVPMDLYGGNIKKDSIVSISPSYSDRPIINGKQGGTVLPKELIMTWEPVYEDEKKIIKIGTPERECIVEKDKVTVIDGSGTKRVFPNEYIDKLEQRFKTFSISGFDADVTGIKIGCTDGTTLTGDDIKTIKEAQK